jgi:hypothetical protein
MRGKKGGREGERVRLDLLAVKDHCRQRTIDTII